ncbi:MAG: ABC transporter permease subunit [Lachnospiraceae bacterium]|nr:ABC transporter permease subunit [Lachnospiraceae bacterium]
MKNLWQLYGFEIKKILKNRLTLIMLAVTAVFIFIEAFIPKLYMTEEMIAFQRELDGQAIDDDLLQKMYPTLIENGNVWTSENAKYSEIARIEKAILPDKEDITGYMAEEMYGSREEAIFSRMKEDDLSEAELEWWKKENSKVNTPFTYQYYLGTINLAQGMSLTLMCIMLIAALSLSTVFTIEHRQRTDQLLISCKYGRSETYFVKIAAGLSVVIGCCIASAILLTLLIAVLYGINGLDAAVQLELPLSAYSFTMGQFILVQMVVMLTAAILFAVFSMAMSEIIKNSLAVMGIMVGIFVFSQLELIPPQYRMLNQMKSMLPSNQISVWSLLEYRLVGVGGSYISSYVASPVIYLIISVILIIAGKVAYDRFQVSGR